MFHIRRLKNGRKLLLDQRVVGGAEAAARGGSGKIQQCFPLRRACGIILECHGDYWAVQKNLVKGCRQTLDCYCVSCELLSDSIADALLFVNILVSGIFHGRFAQQLAVNKPYDL